MATYAELQEQIRYLEAQAKRLERQEQIKRQNKVLSPRDLPRASDVPQAVLFSAKCTTGMPGLKRSESGDRYSRVVTWTASIKDRNGENQTKSYTENRYGESAMVFAIRARLAFEQNELGYRNPVPEEAWVRTVRAWQLDRPGQVFDARLLDIPGSHSQQSSRSHTITLSHGGQRYPRTFGVEDFGSDFHARIAAYHWAHDTLDRLGTYVREVPTARNQLGEMNGVSRFVATAANGIEYVRYTASWKDENGKPQTKSFGAGPKEGLDPSADEAAKQAAFAFRAAFNEAQRTGQPFGKSTPAHAQFDNWRQEFGHPSVVADLLAAFQREQPKQIERPSLRASGQ